tara:strand:- start:8284 stop:9606 length:1323 start_codon:yes stop_codon:yes gene_type:complete
VFITKKRTYEQHHNENPSFYQYSAPINKHHKQIKENINTDICVVGGGLTGLSAALNLSNSGYTVTIIEANQIGSGASGRNGGQLGIGMRKDQFYLEKKFGNEKAKMFWFIGLEAVQEVIDIINNYKIDCAIKPGVLHVGNTKNDYKYFLKEIDHMQKYYDYNDFEYLDEKMIKEEIHSERYFSGLLLKDCYHLNPLKLTYGLMNACLEKGVKIYQNSPASKIIDNSNKISIKVNSYEIKTKKVIVCCNGYLDNLLGSVRSYFMPINNYIIATEPLGDEYAKKLIKRNVAVSDSRFMIDYFRFSEDYRLLFGGPETITANFVKDAKKFVLKRMLKVFPELNDVKIDFAWGGTLAISINRMPQFGTLMKNNLYYAHGYSGHGLAMSVMGGKLIAEKILEKNNKFDLFSSINHFKIPGGDLLRRPIYSTAIIYYRILDYISRL